jgi:hypothetical protein
MTEIKNYKGGMAVRGMMFKSSLMKISHLAKKL